MTQQESNQVVHPQLTADVFDHPRRNDPEAFVDEDEELNEVPIVPTDLDTSSNTVRVSRPVPPRDFLLPRALTMEKELLELAFR